MEKGSLVKIYSYKSLDSTQTTLKEMIRDAKVDIPCAVIADMQNAGVGSRGNSWSGCEGNLFLSFALHVKSLPSDLKLESSSIYFSYILKELLEEKGSKVWLKWPNDFYIQDKKIGGMISSVVREHLICGVGLNLQQAPDGFGVLDIMITKENLLELYFEKIKKQILWKQVFSKYRLEFDKNRNFFTHTENGLISLQRAMLLDDGSIQCDGERIYSLR